jgi:hypothetical protein
VSARETGCPAASQATAPFLAFHHQSSHDRCDRISASLDLFKLDEGVASSGIF